MRLVSSFLYIVSLYILFQSCSGIQVINKADIYSAKFLKKIESIQLIYNDGDKKVALQSLNQIDDNALTKAEIAKKYNLKGVMLYSLKNINEAVESFLYAEENVDRDYNLASNIKLNIASSFFKQDKIDLAYSYIKKNDAEYLNEKEKNTFYSLWFNLAVQYSKPKEVVVALVNLTSSIQSFNQLETYKYKEIMIDNFKQLSNSEKMYILDEYQGSSKVTVAYLAKNEALSLYYSGDKSGAKDIIGWMSSKFSDMSDVKSFVEDFSFRTESYSKIDSKKVGIIAPLSGKLSRYGEKVVAGVNTALKNEKGVRSDIKVLLKDNQNNSFLSRKLIQEMILKHHVSAIVGGLFPHLAKEEYLEARKYGVLFISLSPVYLPKSQKNHLLIEIPGSVESQIRSVLTPENLEYLGKRVSVMYPWTDDGKSYVNELWQRFNNKEIELIGIEDYERGISDYRSSVRGILGLKHPREREEEHQIWYDIKNVNKRNVRIVNILPPVKDFDWVFIPSLPKEAIQILPTFSFFDAKGLKFVGGPSWINKTIQKERRNLGGKVFIVGNDSSDIDLNFLKDYKEVNGYYPGLVDTIAYESIKVLSSVLKDDNFSKRDDLESKILSTKSLSGITSNWSLENGLWVKDMDLLTISSDGFKKVITSNL